uniref:Putative secreted protein n=1 Tax=Rhipicephalus microplus TaxID=6941 RepID=A0A6M2DAM7_RHIMP
MFCFFFFFFCVLILAFFFIRKNKLCSLYITSNTNFSSSDINFQYNSRVIKVCIAGNIKRTQFIFTNKKKCEHEKNEYALALL